MTFNRTWIHQEDASEFHRDMRYIYKGITNRLTTETLGIPKIFDDIRSKSDNPTK